MKGKSRLGMTVLVGLAVMPAAALPPSPQADTQDKSANVRTLTGCLSAGEKSGEYNLLAEDGSTWEIRSKSVKLDDHVGHTVKVTGKVWHPDMHGSKEKTKETVSPKATEHGNLNVSNLSMVSDSCKK